MGVTRPSSRGASRSGSRRNSRSTNRAKQSPDSSKTCMASRGSNRPKSKASKTTRIKEVPTDVRIIPCRPKGSGSRPASGSSVGSTSSHANFTLDALIDMVEDPCKNYPVDLATRLDVSGDTIGRILEIGENETLRRRTEILTELHRARFRCSETLKKQGFDELEENRTETIVADDLDETEETAHRSELKERSDEISKLMLASKQLEDSRAEKIQQLDTFVDQLAVKEEALSEVSKFMSYFSSLFSETLGTDMLEIDDLSKLRADERKEFSKQRNLANRNIREATLRMKSLINCFTHLEDSAVGKGASQTGVSKPKQETSKTRNQDSQCTRISLTGIQRMPKPYLLPYSATWAAPQTHGKVADFHAKLTGVPKTDKEKATKEPPSILAEPLKYQPDLQKMVAQEITKKWRNATGDIRALLDQTAQSQYLRPVQREEQEETMKGEIDHLKIEKETAKKQIAEADATIREQMRAIQVAEQREKSLQDEVSGLRDRNSRLTHELGTAQRQVEELNTKMAELRGEMERRVLEERQKWLDAIRALESKLNERDDQILRLQDDLKAEKENAAMIEAKNARGTETIKELESQVEDLKQMMTRYESEVTQLKHDLDTKDEKIKKLEAELVEAMTKPPPDSESEEDDFEPVDNDARQKKFAKNLPAGARTKIKGRKQHAPKLVKVGADGNEIEDFEEEEDEYDEDGFGPGNSDPFVQKIMSKLNDYEADKDAIVQRETARERMRLQKETIKTRGQLAKCGEQLGEQAMNHLESYHTFSKALQTSLKKSFKGVAGMSDKITDLEMLDLKCRAEHNKIHGEYDKLMNYSQQP